MTIGISLLGWVYHSKVSFKVKLSGKSLYRYILQAVLLKLLDYWIYILFVYVMYMNAGLAVFVAGGIIFALRILIYVFYVFKEPEEQTSSDDDQAFIFGRDKVNPSILDYLGDFKAAYAGYRAVNSDAPVASGGLVSAVVRSALEAGYVDGFLLSRADYSKGEVGYEVKIVTDPNEAEDFATSTYFNIPIEKHFKLMENFEGKLGVVALPYPHAAQADGPKRKLVSC